MVISIIISTISTANAATITVNSLAELKPYLDDDNVNVKLTPGTYSITAADVANGTWGENVPFMDWAKVLMVFEGSNSTFDFTGVTINFNTDLFTAFGRYDVWELHVSGNNNVLKNLTMVDDGSVYDAPTKGATNVHVDGQNNIIDGFHITGKGSSPYFYGDSFGKGSGSIVKLQKHSAFTLRGDYNTVKNTTILHRAYGHCLVMQAANNPTIDSCYIEGEMRSTDDMLAEEGSGSAADKLNFMTTWGYKLPKGYMKALCEEGIRSYNRGETLINGKYIERGTNDITVKNTTVKNVRGGCSIVLSSGSHHIENITLLGCEYGFSVGSNTLINCAADCIYGPAYMNAYDTKSNKIEGDLTILPPSDEFFNGSGCAVFIGSENSNLNIHSEGGAIGEGLDIRVGGQTLAVGQLVSDPHTATGNEINNYTNYPLVVAGGSKNNKGVSGGMVTDLGTNNNFAHYAISAVDIEAEDYSNMFGVSTDITNDEGAGENIDSIDVSDWLEYEINIPFTGTYSMDYRVASANEGGNLLLSIDGLTLDQLIFPATGWVTVRSSAPFFLSEGIQTIRITSKSAAWKLNWMSLLLECREIQVIPFIEGFNRIGESLGKTQSSELTIFPGNTVSIDPEPSAGGSWSWIGPNKFSSDERVVTLTDIQKNQSGSYITTYTNDCGLKSTQTFEINVQDSLFIEAESYSTMEGITNETCFDLGAGENVTSIEPGDWVEYEIDVPFSATYLIDYRIASESAKGEFTASINSTEIEQISFDATGGAQTWATTSSKSPLHLEAGIQTLRITSNSEGWKLNWIKLNGQQVVSSCTLPSVREGFRIKDTSIDWTSGAINITCEDEIDIHVVYESRGTLKETDYLNIYYKLDGAEPIAMAELTNTVDLSMVSATQISGGTIEIIIESSAEGTDGYYDIEQVIVQKTTDPFARIEAEDRNDADGTNNETCSDTGGGENVGSIKDGNWLMFSNLNLTEVNSINARLASQYSGGTIEVRIGSETGEKIGTLEMPNTGNWQKWETTSAQLSKVVGIYDVYLVFKTTASYVGNINWLEFSDAIISSVKNFNNNEARLFPNPVNDKLTITQNSGAKIEIYDYLGIRILSDEIVSDQHEITVSGLKSGIYVVRVLNNGFVKSYKVMKK